MTGAPISPTPDTWRNRRARRDMSSSTIDGAAYMFMVGVAEVYLAAFMLRLGFGPVTAGLFSTVPNLLGAAIQTRVSPLLRRCGSYRRWNGIGAAVQALMFLPLAGLALAAPFMLPPLRERGADWLIAAAAFVVATLYFAAGLAIAPSWSTLSGWLVPARLRAAYFARRSRLIQYFMVAGIVSHGLVMTAAERWRPAADGFVPGRVDPMLAGFAVVFVGACVARLVSARYLFRYSDAPESPHDEHPISFREYVARFRRGGAEDGKFLSALLAMHVASQIAQPYFNPYMIRILGLNDRAMVAGVAGLPAAYTWFLAANYLGRILILPLAGRLAARYGTARLLLVGTLALAPLPVLWFVTGNLWVLLAAQVLGGMAWACWELGGFLIVYDKVAPRERTAMITHQTLCNELAKTGGSLVGAGGLGSFGRGPGGYAWVFWGSAIARLATVLLLVRRAGVEGVGVGGATRPDGSSPTQSK